MTNVYALYNTTNGTSYYFWITAESCILKKIEYHTGKILNETKMSLEEARRCYHALRTRHGLLKSEEFYKENPEFTLYSRERNCTITFQVFEDSDKVSVYWENLDHEDNPEEDTMTKEEARKLWKHLVKEGAIED